MKTFFRYFSVFKVACTYKCYVKEKQEYYCLKNDYENEIEKLLNEVAN